MANKNNAPQQEDQSSQPTNKKLLKQRQRVIEELQEAQAEEARALERLHRAESRLHKRTTRVQRIVAELMLIHQQLGGPATSPPVSVPMLREARLVEATRAADLPVHTQESSVAADSTASPQPNTATIPAADNAAADDEFPSAAQYRVDAMQASEKSPEEEGAPGVAATGVLSPTETGYAQEPQEVAALHSAPVDQVVTQADGPGETGLAATDAAASSVSVEEVAARAREARAAAEAAEQAARQAVERASAAAAHLEHIGAGRHLLQELQLMQIEAERASTIAQETERVAQEAERLASAGEGVINHAPTQNEAYRPDEAYTPKDAPERDESRGYALYTSGEQARTEEDQVRTDAGSSLVGQGAPKARITGPLVEEEEALVEADAAHMVADVAAAAAAEAEAVAEASSARVREARRLAQQADQVLEDARSAVRSGIWSGEDTGQYIQELEQEATHAHALLADAEAAEEQARNAAMNAEAEAEVAEGMAFATSDRAPVNQHRSLSSDGRAERGEGSKPGAAEMPSVKDDEE